MKELLGTTHYGDLADGPPSARLTIAHSRFKARTIRSGSWGGTGGRASASDDASLRLGGR